MHRKTTTTTFSSLSQKHNDGFNKPKKQGVVIPIDGPNELVIPKHDEKKQTQLFLPTNAHKLRQATKRRRNDEQNPIDEDDDFQRTLKLPNKLHRGRPVNPFAANKSSPFLDDVSELRSLIMPKKTSNLAVSTEKQQELLQSFNQAKKEDESNADKVQCPFCAEYLIPMTRSIEQALNEIHEKDKKYEKNQREKEDPSSSFSRPMNVVNKRPVLNSEKDSFCKLHKLELVIKPDGVKKGYPTKIAFEDLGRRIEKLDQELKDVIRNKLASDYRRIAEEAYKELGQNKARSTTSVMNRFEKSLPGYYGPKGANIILEHLVRVYMNSGYLKEKLVSDQLPLEFLQQVLVPEAGFRLIRQDLSKKGPVSNATEKAKSTMAASRDYGNAMFPIENHDIEEPTPNNYTTATVYNLSDDDEESEVEDEDDNSDNYSITSLVSLE
jgi:hypothetical protein